jgi:hypothetical protein
LDYGEGTIAMITHIVFFKFVEPTTANIAATRDKLMAMSDEIPFIVQIEVGVDIVRSGRSYDIALVTRFNSLDDLNSYQVHPYHAGVVVPHVKSVCSSIVAVDYES